MRDQLFLKTAVIGLVLAAGFVLNSARAEENKQDVKHDDGHLHATVFMCNLAFRATGKSIYVGLGYSTMDGKGVLSCYDYIHHETQNIPLKVTARGPGAGLGVTGLVISGNAGGIGISSKPESLLGRYVAVRGQAAAGVGAAASVALHLSNGAATIDVSTQAEGGLGAGVDILSVDLKIDSERVTTIVPDAVKPAQPAVAPTAPASVAATTATATAVAVAANGKGTTETVATATATAPVPASTPVRIVYVGENQPVHLVDAQGHLLQVLYLRPIRKSGTP